MNKRKMTKRQLLNELMVVEDKRAAITASEERLYRRTEKLDELHGSLADDLLAICLKEQKKDGRAFSYVEDPIVFKGNSFTIRTPDWGDRTAKVSVRKVNNVK